jgi:hypothetical protein
MWFAFLAGCAFDASSNGPLASTMADGPSMMSVDAAPASDAPTASDAAQQPDAAIPDARERDAMPDSSCPQGCTPGSDPCCPDDCGPGQSCGSSSGGMHYYRCTGSDCDVVCTGNSSCTVDCAGASGHCGLQCSGSQASCMLECRGATDCPLSCNPPATMLCGTDVKVCGRGCP